MTMKMNSYHQGSSILLVIMKNKLSKPILYCWNCNPKANQLQLRVQIALSPLRAELVKWILKWRDHGTLKSIAVHSDCLPTMNEFYTL